MASLVHDEFNKRQDDIDLFTELLSVLQQGSTLDVLNENTEDIVSLDYSPRLINVLNSVVFLLTYNQIESSMRGCLEELYDEINDAGVGYDSLKPDIQTEVLRGLLRNYESGAKLKEKISGPLNLDAPSASLNVRKVFNGNISLDSIREVTSKYSVTISPPSSCQDGQDINSFKYARNHLAHGMKTFSEYGAIRSTSETLDMSKRASDYIKSIINGFEQYNINQEYKF